MTQATQNTTTVRAMAKEAQDYRSSLESLMAVGRSLLLNPSMEDDTAVGFKILAEDVLEQADHQGDLAVVDGVEEPSAVVELIMQDVLTPRLTEVEEIERALAAKAENEEPVPFTTRDAMTAASMESIYRAEMLGILLENVRLNKTILSMEGMTADQARPCVLELAKRIDVGLEALHISLEDLGETQVLGDMADAVNRIETLVSKAHEAAEEAASEGRDAGASIGSDGEDRLGDVIDAHRGENSNGAILEEGTAVSSVPNDSGAPVESDDSSPVETEEEEVVETEEDAPLEMEEEVVESEEEELPVETEEDGSSEEEEQEEESEDTPPEEEQEEEEEDTSDELDTIDEEEVPVPTSDDDDDVEVETEEEESSEEEEQEESEEEEEDDGTASTESLTEPVVIYDPRNYTDNEQARREAVSMLVSVATDRGLMTEAGKEAAQAEDAVLTSDMFDPVTAETLVKHFDTWLNAALRDGEPNIRSLMALIFP